ncbi:hypothetical protein HOH87_05445 [bacterium]|jgi:hypothetical protein|nr:hypothetical protein [bacterium]
MNKMILNLVGVLGLMSFPVIIYLELGTYDNYLEVLSKFLFKTIVFGLIGMLFLVIIIVLFSYLKQRVLKNK